MLLRENLKKSRKMSGTPSALSRSIWRSKFAPRARGQQSARNVAWNPTVPVFETPAQKEARLETERESANVNTLLRNATTAYQKNRRSRKNRKGSRKNRKGSCKNRKNRKTRKGSRKNRKNRKNRKGSRKN